MLYVWRAQHRFAELPPPQVYCWRGSDPSLGGGRCEGAVEELSSLSESHPEVNRFAGFLEGLGDEIRTLAVEVRMQ